MLSCFTRRISMHRYPQAHPATRVMARTLAHSSKACLALYASTSGNVWCSEIGGLQICVAKPALRSLLSQNKLLCTETIKEQEVVQDCPKAVEQPVPQEPVLGDSLPDDTLTPVSGIGREMWKTPHTLEKLRECKTLEEISFVMKDIQEPYGIREVVVLMASIKKLPSPPPIEFIDKLAEAAMNQCFMAQPKDIAGLMHACAKLKYVNIELLGSLAEQAMLPFQIHNQVLRREHAKLQQKSDTASNPTEFSPQPLFPFQDDLVHRLVQRFVSIQEHDHINSWHASNAIFGISQLGLKDESLFEKIGAVVTRSNILGDYTDQGLMGVFQGLRQMKFCDEGILGELAQVMPAYLERFSEPDLVALLQGFAQAGVKDGKTLTPLIDEATKPNRLMKMTSPSLTFIWTALTSFECATKEQLIRLAAECSRDARLSEFSLKAIYHMFSSMQRLHFRDCSFTGLLVHEILKPIRISDVQERDLATYIYFLGQLQFDDVDATRLLLEKALSPERLPKYEDRGLSSIVHAMSVLGITEGELLIPVVNELAREERLENLSSASIASILSGLGRLNPPKSLPIVKIVQESVKQHRLPEYSELCLAYLLAGLGKMGYRDNDAIHLIVSEVILPKRLESHSPKTLGIIMSSLKELEFADMSLIEPLVKLGCSGTMLETMTDVGLSVLMISLGGLRYRRPEYIGPLMEEILKPERLKSQSEYSLSRIMLAIAQLKVSDLQQLKRILQEISKPERLERFHLAGVAGCLYSFGQLSLKHYDWPAVQEFMKKLGKTENLQQLGSYDLARAIHGICHLQYKGPELSPLLDEAFSQERLRKLSIQDISMICFSIGYLGNRSLHRVQMVLTEISKKSRLQSLGERGLASLVYGLGQMTTCKVPECGQVLLMELVQRDVSAYGRLSCMDIAGMMYGIGQLGLTDQRALRGLIDEVTKPERIADYTSHALTNIMFCLGQLKYRNLQKIAPLVTESSKPRRYTQYTNHGLVGTLFALCQLGVTCEESLRLLLEEAMEQERMLSFSDADFSMLMHSLGQIRPLEPRYVKTVVKQIVSEERLHKFEEKGLCALLAGMVQVRFCNVEIVDAVLKELTKPVRLRSLSERALSSVMYNIGQMGYISPSAMELLGHELERPDRLQSLTLPGLANSIHAIGKLKYDNPKLLKLLMDMLVASDPALGLRETLLSNVMYSLGVHKYHHNDFMGVMDKIMIDASRLSKFSDKGLLTLVYSYDALGLGSQTMVSAISKVVFGNKERLSALSNEQLASLMNILGVMKRRAESRSRQRPFSRRGYG